MRIAHIDTERGWRGGEQQLVSLCGALAARRHDNVAVVRKSGVLLHRLTELGLPILECTPWGEWDLLTARSLRSKLLKNKVDLVHAHTAHGAALAVMSTLHTSIPVVATRRVDFHIRKNPLSRWKYRHVKKIIAVSGRVREVLIEDGIPLAKIAVIPDGVDFRRFDSVVPMTRDELGFPSGAIVIGTIAALVPHKDPATFIRAIHRLHAKNPMIRGVVLGEGELRGELESLVRSLNLKDIVRLLGFQNKVINYLAAFDVFCLSSCEEGLGSSILDAMACRIPVVATRAGGIPEIIEDGKSGYLARSRDPEALADRLAFALNDSARSVIVDNAFRKCEQFDVARVAAEVEQVYSAS